MKNSTGNPIADHMVRQKVGSAHRLRTGKRSEYEYFFIEAFEKNLFSLEDRKEFKAGNPRVSFTGSKLIVEH